MLFASDSVPILRRGGMSRKSVCDVGFELQTVRPGKRVATTRPKEVSKPSSAKPRVYQAARSWNETKLEKLVKAQDFFARAALWPKKAPREDVNGHWLTFVSGHRLTSAHNWG